MRLYCTLAALLLAGCVPDGERDGDDDGVLRAVDCDDEDRSVGAPLVFYEDLDQDGYGSDLSLEACEKPEGHVLMGGDCDDANGDIRPEAPEDCNHVDDDCDGEVDEYLSTTTWYTDDDGDGYGDPDAPVSECDAWPGLVRNDQDCDDTDAAVHPGADEVCHDAVDNDCDGLIDEPSAVDAATWYEDADHDGYGNPDAVALACEAPRDHVVDAQDCDDTDPAIHPAADELCHDGADNDCDGLVDDPSAVDASTWYEDADRDDYGNPDVAAVACVAPEDHVGNADDCDDTDDALNPDTPWYADTDCDGFGDIDALVQQCTQPSGYVDDDEDCDDTDADVHPDADEECGDAIDNDCDGLTDDSSAVDTTTWCLDGDGDGYGDSVLCAQLCDGPSLWVEDDTDCDDADSEINPDADEVCDSGVDNDCDGLADDDDSSVVDAITWYEDADSDGYGDSAVSTDLCVQPSGYVDVDGDCDDTDDEVNPGETEVCDGGTDEDCDGLVDDDDPSSAGDATWYADADGDGYGDPADSMTDCEEPSGYVGNGEDCDDTDSAVSPDATEVCDDGVDDDCDGGPSGCGFSGSYDDGDFDAMYEGVNDYDAAGASAASAGDLDGDGYTDLLVGAPYNDDGAPDAGIVYLIYGGTVADLELDNADVLLEGDNSSDQVGYAPASLAGGGDADGDGYGDLLIGAPYNDDAGYSSAGAAYLILSTPADMELGSADVIFYGDARMEGLGSATAFLGDLDGDGYDEMAIGAVGAGSTTYQGEVYVFYGDSALSSSYSPTSADIIFSGEYASDYAGWAMDAGDVDGDGAADLAIGAYEAYTTSSSRPGAAYVVLGVDDYYGTSTGLSSADARLDGESNGDWAGYNVDLGGDADGDGYADLLVSAHRHDDTYTDAGKAYLVSGSDIEDMDLEDADSSFLGEGDSRYGTYAGYSIALVPDTNGDGYDEVAIGSPNAGGTYSYGGKVYVFLGPVTSGSLELGTDEDACFEGGYSYDSLGASVAGIEDFDGDGFGDLLVGAAQEDSGGTDAGAAYLMLGFGM